MGNDTFLAPLNDTVALTKDTHTVTWQSIVVACILYATTLATIVGNLCVLIAVKMEKKLQTTFNYYIVNLAITDVGVAITAMSFMATHTVLGYWPFGKILCAVWIFFDYGMTFVSVFTLILISLDRFWSVTWSIHYRKHHTKKKCITAIISVWLFMLVMWFPPWIVDRLRNSEPGVCYWDPSQNEEFVYIVAVLGHHGPYCIMVACYVHIFFFMHKRSKVSGIGEGNRPAGHIQDAASSTVDSMMPHVDSDLLSSRTAVFSINRTRTNESLIASTSNTLKVPTTVKVRSRPVEIVENRAMRERRVFVTLTYIMIAYGILWLPFHIIFDISIADPTIVPEELLNLSFWMAYLNSTINPFLYNFSSPEFRKAFRRIFKHISMCE